MMLVHEDGSIRMLIWVLLASEQKVRNVLVR